MNSGPISYLAAVVTLTAPRGIGQYIRQHFFDRTFQGLYHTNAFDLALLIPYFVVLVLLASYGVHRYTLVYLYYKNKKNRTTDPPAYFPDLPRVTVQLPIFNEQYVVDRLVDAVCRMVECNVGIGIVPETTARRAARTMAIVAVELSDPWAVRELTICIRRLRELPGYARQLVEHLRAGA